MYMKSSALALIIYLISTTGCTKDYNLNLGSPKTVYAIDGRISTMRGPYFVQITKSSNSLGRQGSFPTGLIDTTYAVKGALVVISDDMGVTDTLVPPPDYVDEYTYSYQNGKLDSTFESVSYGLYSYSQGYYQTTKIHGIAGHTYHLLIRIGTEEFHSTAYLPPVAALDSVVLKDTIVDPDGSRGKLPLTYFKEPQNEKNYYMLQFMHDIREYPYDVTTGSFRYEQLILPYYTVDDKILSPYVNGLAVREIITSQYKYSRGLDYQFPPGMPIQVLLSSLTRDAYEYFTVIANQFEDDGSVYKPVPASAPGNISGGALGLFWATDVSYKLVD